MVTKMNVIVCFMFILICHGCPDPLNEDQQKVCDDRVNNDEIEECPHKPTVFLIGPTRNGKSFYGNLLLQYANGVVDDEEEAFEASPDEVSVTSSIKCICGTKYRVCDSPGIPDICGRADEYLDGIVNFVKQNRPNLILFVLDAGYNLMNSVSKHYYQALIRCFYAFSQKNTYILFNKVTGNKKQFKKNLKIYNDKLQKVGNWLGINYLTNNITHPFDKFELTKTAKLIIDGFINDPPSLYTNKYKPFTKIIENAAKGIELCADMFIIDEYEEKIRIKQSDLDWYARQIALLNNNIAIGITLGVAAVHVTSAFCPMCAIGCLLVTAGPVQDFVRQKSALQKNVGELKGKLEMLKIDAGKRIKECVAEIKEIELMAQALCITTPSFKNKLRELSELVEPLKYELQYES